MSLTAPRPQRELVPEGTHIARCIGLVHIGTYDDEYKGKAIKKNEIRLTFELPMEKREFKEGEGEKPMVISKAYTLSMGNKANLRKLIEGMIGTALDDDEAFAFDHESLVGMPCLITIKHKKSQTGNSYELISSASPLMKGQTCPDAINPIKVLTYSKWDEKQFEALPAFLKELMASTEEYQRLHGGEKTDKARPAVTKENYPDGPDPDSVPF